MVKINQEQAKEFLDNIKEEDSVMIFTHKDLDGFASGILFLDFCKKKGAKVEARIIDYGISKISDTELEKVNKIMIADLAPEIVWEDLQKLSNKEIFYTDHHQEDDNSPIPNFVLELRTTKEGYIPSSRTCFEICGGKNWLGILGTLSDMGQLHEINKNFLEEFYKKNNTNYENTKTFVEKFNDIIIFFSASLEAFNKIANLKKMTDIEELKEFYEPVEKEFVRLEEKLRESKEEFNEIVYFFLESQFKMIKSSFVTGASGKKPEKIYIFATPKKENLISISGRNQSQKYNVCQLMQDCLSGLKDGSAKGHKTATGGQVDKSDLEKFKQNLKNYDIEQAKI